MPKLNGLEATLAIRQSSPETEVLILTQHESVEMVRHAFEAGARGYVVKSNVANELLSAIEAVGNHQFFFSEKWQTSGHSMLGADGRALDRVEIEGQAEQRTAALQKLATNLLYHQDQERQSIGQELREGIGRDLSGIAFNLELMAKSNGHGADPLFAEAVQLARHAVARARALSQSLDPPLLVEIGLASAAQWLIENFRVRTGIEVHAEWICADRLPLEIETAFFWILDEALANIRAHSGAKFADVCVKLDAQGAVLEVRDHGCGMPRHVVDRFGRGDVGSGVGLAVIRERVREWGGEVDLWSGPNGTALRAHIPATAIRLLTPRAPREEPPEAEEASAACA